ncbi:MAG: hypothetical protein ACRCUM_02780 [Mycoplasmoidaceae bacterium]
MVFWRKSKSEVSKKYVDEQDAKILLKLDLKADKDYVDKRDNDLNNIIVELGDDFEEYNLRKQDKLVAGENITITGNTISAYVSSGKWIRRVDYKIDEFYNHIVISNVENYSYIMLTFIAYTISNNPITFFSSYIDIEMLKFMNGNSLLLNNNEAGGNALWYSPDTKEVKISMGYQLKNQLSSFEMYCKEK